MSSRQRALATHRRRMKRKGFVRLEVKARREDAQLLRAIAAALGDSGKARALEGWLEAVGKASDDRILTVDKAVADEWGRIITPRPVPGIDGLLAATTKVHAMALVARNETDVAGPGARVLNPFS